jgi:hypothetical protein
VDESKLQIDDNSGKVGSIDLSRNAGFGEFWKKRARANSSMGDASMASVCIRTPLGPGVVDWTTPNPSGPEWRYSVKPESTSALVHGAAPSQNSDAVFRYYWGCGIALKVPDSCTLTINNGSASQCCNAAIASLGYVVQWVNPSAHGFPNCPL